MYFLANSNARTLASFCVALLCSAVASSQGIPEPDLILYGTVRNRELLNTRVTGGTLVWQFQRWTNNVPAGRALTLTSYLGNVLDEFSYVLRVPCESPHISSPSSNLTVLALSPSTNWYRSTVTVDGLPATFVVPTQAAIAATSNLRGRVLRVDLTISDPCDDWNQNLICDEWEDRYFGRGIDPNDDPDGDGMSNLEEFRAGTVPTDPTSLFIFVNARSLEGGRFELSWTSADGRVYSLLRYDSVVATNATVVRDAIAATPPINVLVDTNASGLDPAFYRVRQHP
jgi:hypothetical protein